VQIREMSCFGRANDQSERLGPFDTTGDTIEKLRLQRRSVRAGWGA
jgi:hypothetical protein